MVGKCDPIVIDDEYVELFSRITTKQEPKYEIRYTCKEAEQKYPKEKALKFLRTNIQFVLHPQEVTAVIGHKFMTIYMLCGDYSISYITQHSEM